MLSSCICQLRSLLCCNIHPSSYILFVFNNLFKMQYFKFHLPCHVIFTTYIFCTLSYLLTINKPICGWHLFWCFFFHHFCDDFSSLTVKLQIFRNLCSCLFKGSYLITQTSLIRPHGEGVTRAHGPILFSLSWI